MKRSWLGIAAMLLTIGGAALQPQTASAGIGISINIGPPVLPVYTQPPCPTEGYQWIPGYWAWSDAGYYWVPGVWVAPPSVGVLWTPGYWGYENRAYLWHEGYWGPHVGFYGGVNYGFGYPGSGFVGGGWFGNTYRYNTAVVAVNRTVVRNVYVDRTVIHNTTIINNNRISYNGPGGLNARPTQQEQFAMRERHAAITQNQIAHAQQARADRSEFASVNHGRPTNIAMDSVNGRRFDQAGRIANGVANGRLTPGETGRLENREANLNHEVRADRQANNGTLTPAERQQVNHQQNNLNRSIYDDKHNAAQPAYGNNRVDDRRAQQQQRIAQGIDRGQINAREAARTENNERNINRQVRAERQANGGSLTPQERHQVNHEQNHESREVHQDRHNNR